MNDGTRAKPEKPKPQMRVELRLRGSISGDWWQATYYRNGVYAGASHVSGIRPIRALQVWVGKRHYAKAAL